MNYNFYNDEDSSKSNLMDFDKIVLSSQNYEDWENSEQNLEIYNLENI